MPIPGKPAFEQFEEALRNSWYAVERRPDDGDLKTVDPLKLARERLGF